MCAKQAWEIRSSPFCAGVASRHSLLMLQSETKILHYGLINSIMHNAWLVCAPSAN